ncbi:hypothetical protein GCM10018773_63460 [Streptomyces candidus]|nr:hypothetical protein GCM10018773_63460 [Streptomyces candidus]
MPSRGGSVTNVRAETREFPTVPPSGMGASATGSAVPAGEAGDVSRPSALFGRSTAWNVGGIGAGKVRAVCGVPARSRDSGPVPGPLRGSGRPAQL